MTDIYQWARDWGVPAAAVADLEARVGLQGLGTTRPEDGKSESAAQARVRLEAASKGVRLFRNNVGVLPDQRGVPVRFGLANESSQMNKIVKSADLIGWRPVLITPAHVGRFIAQFVSREMKRPGWTHNPNDAHEAAQMRWLTMVLSAGGDAAFATGEGTL